MYAESILINQIANATGYEVRYSEDKISDIYSVTSLHPLVWVGHVAVHLHDKSPAGIFSDGYGDLENPELLLTNITFLCKRSELHSVRENIRDSYKNFSPFPEDANKSNIIFIEASVLAKSSTNIYWQETVGYIFPRIN